MTSISNTRSCVSKIPSVIRKNPRRTGLFLAVVIITAVGFCLGSYYGPAQAFLESELGKYVIGAAAFMDLGALISVFVPSCSLRKRPAILTSTSVPAHSMIYYSRYKSQEKLGETAAELELQSETWNRQESNDPSTPERKSIEAKEPKLFLLVELPGSIKLLSVVEDNTRTNVLIRKSHFRANRYNRILKPKAHLIISKTYFTLIQIETMIRLSRHLPEELKIARMTADLEPNTGWIVFQNKQDSDKYYIVNSEGTLQEICLAELKKLI